MSEPRMPRADAVPFTTQGAEQRWVGWHSAPLGRSGATIVEAEMVDWSGAVPASVETVVHVLLPGETPVSPPSLLMAWPGTHGFLIRRVPTDGRPRGRAPVPRASRSGRPFEFAFGKMQQDLESETISARLS